MKDTKLANNYLVIGNSYLEEGNLLKAKKFFNKAYLADPTNINVLYEFALLCAESKDDIQAINYYDKILELDENEAGAHYGKAIIYDENNETNKAVESYKEAIKKDDEYFHAYLYLADIYDRQKDFQVAEDYYLKAINLESDNIWGYMNYGSFLEIQNRDNEALKMFNKVLSLSSNHYLALFNKGVVLAKLGRIKEAISSYEESADQNLKYPYTFLNLAVIYKNNNNYTLAKEIITKGIQYNADVSVLYYNRGLFSVYLKEFDQGFADLKEAIELSPSLKSYAMKDEEYSELFKHKQFI